MRQAQGTKRGHLRRKEASHLEPSQGSPNFAACACDVACDRRERRADRCPRALVGSTLVSGTASSRSIRQRSEAARSSRRFVAPDCRVQHDTLGRRIDHDIPKLACEPIIFEQKRDIQIPIWQPGLRGN